MLVSFIRLHAIKKIQVEKYHQSGAFPFFSPLLGDFSPHLTFLNKQTNHMLIMEKMKHEKIFLFFFFTSQVVAESLNIHCIIDLFMENKNKTVL